MFNYILEHWVIFAVIYAIGFIAMFIMLAAVFMVIYREEQAGKKHSPELYKRRDSLQIIVVGIISTVFVSAIWFVILIGAGIAWVITSIKEWWESYD